MGYKAQGIPLHERKICNGLCGSCINWTNGMRYTAAGDLYGCKICGFVKDQENCSDYKEEK